MGMDARALEVEDRRRERKQSKKYLAFGEIEGSSVEGEKSGKKKDRRKRSEGAVHSEKGFSVVVDEIDDVQRFSGEKEKSKKKDRRKEVEGAVDGFSGSKEEERGVEDSAKRKVDGKKIKDFHQMDSKIGFADAESGEKKRKKKKSRSDGNDRNVLTLSEEDNFGAYNDKKKQRAERSDKLGIASPASETKMKTGKEENEKKEKKKKKRHISDDNQYENDSQEKSALGKGLDSTIDENNSKRKKRKKVKQGCDDEHGMKYEGLGSESIDTRNGIREKKKKHMSDCRIPACEVSNGIVEVSAGEQAGEMEEESAGNVVGEDERLSVKKKKSNKIRFAEASSTGELGGECMSGSSRMVKVSHSGNCEDNQPISKKKTDRKEYQKKKSVDFQEKLKTKDEDAKSNDMDHRVTVDEHRRGSNDHSNTKFHKRVTFSSEVQVFPPSDNDGDQGKLLDGKRFSKEEDEMIKEAVLNYIKVHDLGSNGLEMVLNCIKHSETRGCWKEIGAVIPRRSYLSVYHRAHILFERSDIRKWSPEEYELIKSYHAEHGADWKTLAAELGRHRHHLKDTWRRIRLPNSKKGPWSQEEYQKLFELVHLDLRMKALEEKKTKYGMLRNNIAWEAISDNMSTRTSVNCCKKWYDQLTSSMVVEGIWNDSDDYLLVSALVDVDACSAQEVDWDGLLDHRTGEICRRRWNQMTKYIGEHQQKSFPEQVELLATRYYQVIPVQSMEREKSLHEDVEPSP